MDITQLIDRMCTTWRHDFGLTRDIDDDGGVTADMTESGRNALRQEMAQLLDHHAEDIAKWYATNIPGAGMPVENSFYLQDSRSFADNNMYFWAKEGKGYTTDLRKAEVFTLDKAKRQQAIRETDIPWPKSYIDTRAAPAVDFKYCRHADVAEVLKK